MARRKKRRISYFLVVTMMIVCFTFILGLRYGRGVDYMHYVDIFEKGEEEGGQRLFLLFNDFLRAIGFNKYTCFIAYSFLEGLCLVRFLKRYKKWGRIIYPLALLSVWVLDEAFIRQAFSYSFLLLSIMGLFEINIDKGKIYKQLFAHYGKRCFSIFFWLLVSVSLHTANIFIFIVFAFLYVFANKTIPIYISLPLAIFCQYFFAGWFDFSSISPLLSFIGSQNGIFSSYVENSNMWFSSDAINDIYARNFLISIVQLCGVSSLFYLGDIVINKYHKNRESITIYNVFVIGSLTLMAFNGLELFRRMASFMELWWFYPLTLVLLHRKQIMRKNILIKTTYVFLIWYLYTFLRYLFTPGAATLFIWDIA